ncbi:MAG: gliding motility-associated C-terminal domain-containing protein [Bacteroidales bacterium]|nr:gliding motility-associated C-terminal domain-containing protein [Bacteroidales bacterium]
MNLRSFTSFFLLLACTTLRAQVPAILFSENKNQWQQSVLYRAQLYGGLMYAEKNCLTYQFYDTQAAHSHAGLQDEELELSHEELQASLEEFTKFGTQSLIERKKLERNQHHQEHEHNAAQVKKSHAYKVYFVGMNAGVIVQAYEREAGVENYFIGNNPKTWARNVASYKKIQYKDIYKHTDLYMYDAHGTLKYDFVVYPGGNPTKIKLRYDGVKRLHIDQSGNLTITTSVNSVVEQKPFAFQIIAGDTVEIPCSYSLQGFELSYNVASYNKNYTLFIDPELIFSTYTGSTSDNWGFTATYDHNNNVYAGGIVESFGYPVNTGAMQTNYGGGSWDVGIIKYDPSGSKRLYATYLGGTSAEMPHSLIVNSKNELLILGTTGSANFPTRGAIQSTFAGGKSIIYDNTIDFSNGVDMFVARLSADGSQLLSSTFMGGSGNDGLNYDGEYDLEYGNGYLYYNYGDGARGEIMVDNHDNVYVASTTFSQNFPTKNAFQSTSGGSQDGVVFKLNAAMTNLEWSSYIGGSDKDAAYSITIDNDDNVFVTGGTCSPAMKVAFNGFIPSRIGGTVDAFLIKLNQSGNFQAGTYFGSNRYDQAHFVRSNSLGNIFLFGQTTATGSTLIYNAKFQQPGSGQFLASFSNDLSSLNWSTVFGSGIGTPNITPTAFEVDICNRIYLAGCGREWPDPSKNIGWYFDDHFGYMRYDGAGWRMVQGTKNMPITPNAYQDYTDGKDFYIMVIDDDANALEYATYFGEINYGGIVSYDGLYYTNIPCSASGRDHVDGGTSRFDSKGYVYQSACASCGGCQQFPTAPKPGAWSTSNNSSNCNNAVMRFFIDFGLLIADFELPEVTCSANELTFTNKTRHHYSNPDLHYEWNFGDGTPISTDENPTHIFANPGEYVITLLVRDESSCNLEDTISKKLVIAEQIAYETLPAKSICAGETIEIGIPNEYDPLYNYSWNPSEGLSAPNRPQSEATPGETTDYELTVGTNWCKTIYKQSVNVFTNDYHIVKLEVTQNGVVHNPVCSGEAFTVTAYTSAPTKRYIWSTSPTFNPIINADFSQNSITFMPAGNTVRYYVRTLSEYCDFYDEAMVEITVSHNDIESFGDAFICQGETTTIGVNNLYPSNSMTYSWSPQHFIVSGAQSSQAVVKPTESTYFKIYARNQDGCVKTDSVYVEVNDLRVETIANTPISCYGAHDASIVVTHFGGVAPHTYLWNDGSDLTAKTNIGKGTYSIMITDDMGCYANEVFEVTEPQPIVIQNIATAHVSCEAACNGHIELSITGGTEPYTIQWNNGKKTAALHNICTGNYAAEVSDAHNCPAVSTQRITIAVDARLPLLNATAEKYMVYKGQKIQLSAIETPQDGVQYMWTPMIWIENAYSHRATANPQQSYSYTVHATDQYGCENTDTIHLQVVEWDCSKEFIFVPTAFTPNNDGVNDLFEIKSGAISELEFAIYDRWGEKLFETTNLNAQWDGKYKGKPLEPQVLVYYIHARCIDNREFKDKGNITILK